MTGIKKPLQAKKSLGQHFLRDKTVIDRILSAIPWDAGEMIVEIGPGQGALTEGIYAYLDERDMVQRLVLIEYDEDLLPALRTRFPKATLVHADATQVHWQEIMEKKSWILVSNLPYNAGTAIVSDALWSTHPPKAAVIMLQKEVADRMLAQPPHMSVLSVAIQVYATGERICVVPPGAFAPPPKVDSAVISLRFREAYPRVFAESILKIAKKGFSHPRKQLPQTLVHAIGGEKENWIQFLEKRGFHARVRPSELSLEAWSTLAEYEKEIYAQHNASS